MKRVIMIAVLATMMSCGSKKERIVERQKEIKNEIKAFDPARDSLSRLLLQSAFDETDNLPIEAELGKIADKMKLLQAEYDSLEFELKKY